MSWVAAAVSGGAGLAAVLVVAGLSEAGWFSQAARDNLLDFVVLPLMAAGTLSQLRARKAQLWLRDRTLCLRRGRHTVEVPVDTALRSLGPWKRADAGEAGVLLHLTQPQGASLRIAGRDARFRDPAVGVAAAQSGYDVLLERGDFDALLGELGLSAGAAATPATRATPFGVPTAAAPVDAEVLLQRNEFSRGAVSAMLAVFALWMAALCAVAYALERALSADAFAVALYPVALGFFVGCVLHCWRRARGTARVHALTIREGEVIFARPDGRVIASAPLERVALTPGRWRKDDGTGRRQSLPTLTIALPGARPARVTVCVLDTRYGWSREPARSPAPPYMVSPLAWPALLAALRVDAWVAFDAARDATGFGSLTAR